MKIKHLISEAPLPPGKRVGINLKIERFDDLRRKLFQYEQSIQSANNMTVPPEVLQQLEDMKAKIRDSVQKLHAEIAEKEEASTTKGVPKSIYKFLQGVEKNCSEIMKIYKNMNRGYDAKFLYRGSSNSQDAIYGKPFEARKAKDSNQELSDYLNQVINDSGLRARRDNAIFVTGDQGQASGYAKPGTYIIFPKDGFAFTWSPNEKDLVFNNRKALEFIDDDIITQIRSAIKENWESVKKFFPHRYDDSLSDFFSSYEIQSDYPGFQSAVREKLISSDFAKYTDGISSLLNIEKVKEYFGFSDQNLAKAIRSKHEIYVDGYYYGLRHTHQDHLLAYLKQMEKPPSENDDLNAMPDLEDLVIGGTDVFTVISGQYEGMSGTVDYVYYSDDKVELKTNYGMHIMVKHDELKPGGSMTTPPPPQLKVDDQVEIVIGPNKGKKGKVNFVNDAGTKADILFDGDDFSSYTPTHMLKKIESSEEPSDSTDYDKNLEPIDDDNKIGAFDLNDPKIESLINNSKEAGYVTYTQLSDILPDNVQFQDIENFLTYLAKLNIEVKD
jgi:ribosomal protein L24